MTKNKTIDWQDWVSIFSAIFGAIIIASIIMLKPNPSSNQKSLQKSQSQETNSRTQNNNTEERNQRKKAPIEQASPEKALRDYYDTINSDKYQTAWNSLSSELQQSPTLHPEGYKSYTDWWTQVTRVDVLSTELVSADELNSTVDVNLRYLMSQSGKEVNQAVRFNFIWDQSSDRWLIDGVKRLPPQNKTIYHSDRLPVGSYNFYERSLRKNVSYIREGNTMVGAVYDRQQSSAITCFAATISRNKADVEWWGNLEPLGLSGQRVNRNYSITAFTADNSAPRVGLDNPSAVKQCQN
ncbi:MAG: hypothetical protein F6J86_26285 [Symploca sp. SIO1B1]|nr:hypothetical protein [Symploca sp. SIO1B1]